MLLHIVYNHFYRLIVLEEHLVHRYYGSHLGQGVDATPSAAGRIPTTCDKEVIRLVPKCNYTNRVEHRHVMILHTLGRDYVFHRAMFQEVAVIDGHRFVQKLPEGARSLVFEGDQCP